MRALSHRKKNSLGLYLAWLPAVFTSGLFLFGCGSSDSHAAQLSMPGHILILQSASGGPYEEFTQQFKQTLAGNTTQPDFQISTLVATRDSHTELAALSASDLLVAVGTHAMEIALHSKTSAPILGVLVPRITAEQLTHSQDIPPHRLSMIYLDQPMSRYFALIRLILPHAKKIGIVLGPATSAETHPVSLAARQAHVIPITATVSMSDETPLPALKKILDDSEVVLALPDPMVYNRYTLPPLLLTTFRYRVPVIGFSDAIVHAGAMAGVYSSPGQIGQQAAELILSAQTATTRQYPHYFTVSFNQAVARALDISLPDPKTAEAVLQKEADGQ